MKKYLLVFFILLFPSLILAEDYSRFNWSRVPFDSNAFIDYSKISGDKVHGFKVLTLYTYEEISSAQMWGLSEVQLIEINCQNATMRNLKYIWTEGSMGRGKVTYVGGPSKTFSIMKVLDGTFERNIFKFICK